MVKNGLPEVKYWCCKMLGVLEMFVVKKRTYNIQYTVTNLLPSQRNLQ